VHFSASFFVVTLTRSNRRDPFDSQRMSRLCDCTPAIVIDSLLIIFEPINGDQDLPSNKTLFDDSVLQVYLPIFGGQPLGGFVRDNLQDVIEYLRAENCVLRERLGKKRILFINDQRRRLDVKGKILGRNAAL
jgi:hypothetical protein